LDAEFVEHARANCACRWKLELATVLIGCNHAHLVQEDGQWKVVGNPTEGAMLAAGPKAGAS